MGRADTADRTRARPPLSGEDGGARADPRGWGSLYEPGVAEATAVPAPDMLTMFSDAVHRVPTAFAVSYLDQPPITYAELEQAASRLAGWLAGAGIGHGNRVALALQNVPAFVIAALAAWKRGAIPLPLNPIYQPAELGPILAEAKPAVIVCDVRDAQTMATAAARGGITPRLLVTDAAASQTMVDELVMGSSASPFVGREWLAPILADGGVACPDATVMPGDLALLMYTSGTTGRPKGVMLSHASVAIGARAITAWNRHRAGSRILILAPLFHITGFVAQMASALDAGAEMVLPYRMLPDVVLPLIRRRRPTHTIAAITAFNALASHPGADRADFASFERVMTGGAPVAPSLHRMVHERTGILLRPGYGMTETSSITHMSPFGIDVPVDAASGALAIGVPVPGTDAMIVDDAGAPVPVGTPGELLMRGPQVMTGYWRQPEMTAEALSGGWMHSGDIAVRDEAGWFYIVDRKKDVIIASGYKVWPREVEDCLYRHPAVREAAVVGAPDPYRGETVKACVSLRDGHAASAADLIAHCRAELAAYKAPRLVEIMAELPKTTTGKIQRNVLRDAPRASASDQAGPKS